MIRTKIPNVVNVLIILIIISTGCTTTKKPIIENTQMPPKNQADHTPIPTFNSTVTADPTATAPEPTSLPTETPLPPAASFPDPTGYQWSLVVNGLTRPVDIVSAFDNTGLIYVVEQVGVIRILKDGKLLPEPFLDIRDRVGSRGNEQGLLGIAFHPQYYKNRLFYVDYTNLTGDTVIARFATIPDSTKADPLSESIILTIHQPFANHNGGNLIFGPDGYLWIGMGDGGSQGDPKNNGQSSQTLLAKLLRIDVDHGDPYSIPADNPYADGGGLPEIWAIGLRNPWRFSFDKLTGDLYIGDVGQDLWEEIDYLPYGFKSTPVNFGWSRREGTHPYMDPAGADTAGLTDPVFDYGSDKGCSVTGGFVYRGEKLPEFQGVYLFGDYCSGIIMGLIRKDASTWESKVLFNTPYKISSFGEDYNGDIYLLDLNGGVYRLEKKP